MSGIPAARPVPALSPGDLARLAGRLPTFETSPMVEELAVLATFDPDRAVPPAYLAETQAVSDQLADRDERREWMLKERTRTDVLARLLRSGGRQALLDTRARSHATLDSALQRMLDAALAGQAVQPETLTEDELVAALHVGRWCAAAGSFGGVPDLLPPGFERERIDGRLALLETIRPVFEITSDGCVGRGAERDRLRRHVEGPGPNATLLDHPALLVYGVGGVGKSTLVAQFIRDLADSDALPPTAWAYLDLDRPSLSSYDPLRLLADIARQVGAQFPITRRYLDLNTLEALESGSGEGLDYEGAESWRMLVARLAPAVQDACNGRLVVVLDTFEELQRKERHLGENRLSELLYKMFVELSDHLRHFRLVVSGRAPAATFLSSRHTDQRLHVKAFRGQAAIDVLAHLYVRELERLPKPTGEPPLDPQLADTIVRTVGGSPLTLKLAARVLALEGAGSLQDAADRARAVGRVRKDFVDGFLYGRILWHLRGVRREDTEAMREVAKASLALRQVTADLLRGIVLPAIGRTDLDPAAMMRGLAAETALADERGGVLRLREELRAPALLALRYDSPGLVEDVHHRAANWYAAHPSLPHATSERAYHLLALGDDEALAGLDAAAVRDSERSLADLPETGRRLVEQALIDPRSLGATLTRLAEERELEAAVRRALDAGQPDYAAAVLSDPASWSPTTPLHRYAAILAESRGEIDEALAAAARDVAAAALARTPERFCAAAIRQALMIERWYGGREGAAVAAAADAGQGADLLAGHPALRLELQLNRLAMVERADPAADTWLLDLDARALLQRVDASTLASSTALTRLLAATLGRDDPGYVLTAVRTVGLGTTTYSGHLQSLARVLAEWDLNHRPAGSLSLGLGLATANPTSVDVLTPVWLQAIVGSSADAVPLLDRAFSLEAPPSGVVEALRRIYLWWGVDPQRVGMYVAGAAPPEPPETERAPAVPAAEPEPHFLDQPLDVSDKRAERLVRTLTGAYPTATDLQVLAARADIDVGALNYRQTKGRVTRDLLELAATTGRLGALVEQVLADPATRSFHGEIRALVGDEWLERHGIGPDDASS